MNGLRVLLAARKSRKADDAETQYERQDFRARQWAEREGHAVVHATADVKSSQTPPWTRKSLGPWMRDAQKLAMYDAILISDTDRLSRGTDEDFHYIEDWAYRNGKRILVADGPRFPPREGPMGDSDRYQWIAQKRAARTYWEAVRDKHADTREVIKANGGAIGMPPFGYRVAGSKLHKTFVIEAVEGPIVAEAFRRIAEGRTTTSVAVWLAEVAPKTWGGKSVPWRVTTVTGMIKRRTYLGKREHFEFEPIVSQDLWDRANAAILGRGGMRDKGGRRTGHGYSGLIFCECGSRLYRHYIGRGTERYRCGRGRTGNVAEQKCPYPSVVFDDVNAAVDALMADDLTHEFVMVTLGGDASKQAELAEINPT